MRSEVLKVVAVFAMGAAVFIGGYQYAAALYSEDIAKMREEYALKAQSLEAEYREKEALSKQAVADAWAQRDAAYARMRDLSADANRVRLEADAVKRKLSRAGDVTCKRERRQLPDAQNYSQEVESYFKEVSSYLQALR